MLQKKDRHPTLLECLSFYFLPGSALHQSPSQYSLVLVQTTLTQPRLELVQSEECWCQTNGCFKATKISPRRRSLPSAPKFITDLVLFWCQSVVPGSVLVVGGASMNALGRLPALWVSTEQSELHTERGGGGMTPAQSR